MKTSNICYLCRSKIACFPCSLTPLDLIAVLVVKTVTVVLHQ